MSALRKLSLWWLAFSLAGLVLSACMGGEDDEAVDVGVVASQMSAARRYPIYGPKNDRVFVLKRRGPTLILTDDQSRPLAKASLRRDEKQVVVRNGAGAIVAHVKRQGDVVELTEPTGKSLATLGPLDGKSTVELRQGDLAFPFTASEPMRVEGSLESPRRVTGTTDKINKLAIFDDKNEEESLFSVDARSGLGTLAFAVLTLESLSPPTRLGLAAYLCEFEASYGN